MKKIFTLMLTLACALFAGVSCTQDGTDDGKVPVVTVIGAPEENLSADGGSFTLNYSIQNESLTGGLSVKSKAGWLHVGDVGADTVPFTYDANTDAPGSPAREGVIEFVYDGAEPVSVTVKQESGVEVFSVSFSDVSTNSALATLTATDQNVDWLALCYPASQMADFESPSEFINDQVAAAKAQKMPYLGMFGKINREVSGGYGKGNSAAPFECMLNSGVTDDKLYMFVLGYNVDADQVDWTYDNSQLATPIHVFEVLLLPAPVVTITSLEESVTAEQGSIAIDVNIKNPVPGAYFSFSTNVAWVTPSYADNKITLAYSENVAALSRKAIITVDYVKKVSYGEAGTDNYYEYEESLIGSQYAIVLTQAKDKNAQSVTFNFSVKESHFNHFVVDVDASDDAATYVLRAMPANGYDGKLADIDWLAQVANDMRYPDNNAYYTGDQTGCVIKINPNDFEWRGLDYYVYAFAVDADHTMPLGEASYVLTVVDNSDTPQLNWVAEGNVIWNEDADRFDLVAEPGAAITVKYALKNPTANGLVKINASGEIDDDNNVIVEGLPAIDEVNQTVSFTISPFDASKNYHYCDIGLAYTNAEGDTWNITTPSLRVKQIEPDPKTLPYEETFATSQGDFAIADEWLNGLSYVWKHDSTYSCMKASAFYGGAARNTESWLVSPAIDLTNATAPVLTFEHTHKFGVVAEEQLTLYLKEVKSYSWVQLPIENYDDSGKYTFVGNTIDLAAYVGKKVVLGFKYTSSDEGAATWEIKNFKVAEK